MNLKNGEIIWNRKLNRDFGWNDVFYANDSTLMVVASGLHAINLKTGKGWDYDAETGGKKLIMSNEGSVYGLVLNTIRDSSNIYFASKEQLAKIDK